VRLNANVEQAPGYPFLRVAEARRGAQQRGLEIVDLSLGQPTDPAPQAVRDALAHGAATLALCEYPTTAGLEELRRAICGWVARRYGVELDPDHEVLPTLGAKEPIALLARLFAARGVRSADELDDAIIAYVKKEYNLALGERTAEEIKMAIGSACELEEELHAEIRGRDLVTGLPKTVITSTRDIRSAIDEPVSAIVDAVKSTLDKTPPELAADIMTQGIVLTGGGALLHGLDVRLRAETNMPIIVAPDPLNCVALGSGMCLEEFDALRQVLSSSSSR